MLNDALRLGGRDQAKPSRKRESKHDAECHCLAMQQAIGESRCRLEGMAKRVAEVEERPVAGLALVARHDRRLGAAARGNRFIARRAAGEDLAPPGLERAEERRIVDEAVLGDFGIAGTELARWQGIEQAG